MSHPLAKVVIRADVGHWVALYVRTGAPESSRVLGSINIAAVARHQHRRVDWIDLMKHLAVELTRDAVGREVRWCDVVVEGDG